MAGKATVGSLYYQVVLDPNGFARGATKIRSEQAALKKSIQNFDQWNKSKKDTYKEEMLERIRVMRKLLQEGKLSNEKFKQLYKGEADAYKRHQKEIIAAAKRKQDILDKQASRERKRMVARAKERQKEIRDGKYGFKMMMSAHIGDIKKGFSKGGFQGMTEVANSMQMMFMKFWPFLVGWQVLKGIVMSIGRTIAGIVRAADQKKKQLLILSTLLGGNKTKANELRDSLVKYAKDTAFSTAQTMELATQMKALGVATKDITKNMRLFGTLAMGDPAKFKLIAKAFTDVKSLGRLMGREVIQFANQGVPLLQELSEMYGISVADLMAKIEAGAVSFDDVEKALERIKARFGDIDKAALETATGQWDALKENMQEFWADGGGGLSEFFTTIFSGFNIAVDWARSLQESFSGASQGFKDFMAFMSGPLGWSAMFNSVREVEGRVANLLAMFGMTEWRDNWLLQEKIARASERAKEAEAERNELIKAQNEELLKQRDIVKKMQTRLDYARGAKADYMDKVMGDSTQRSVLDAELAARKAYTGAIENGLGHEAALQHAEWAKEIAAKEAEGTADKKKADKDRAAGSLPSEVFKQNSVEEFRFLAQMRANAEREAAADARNNKLINNNNTNTQATVDAINNIDVEFLIEDTVTLGPV